MNIEQMQSEVAEASSDVARAWIDSILDSIHNYAGYHDLAPLFERIAKEYPQDFVDALPWRERQRLCEEAVTSRDADREHFEDLSRVR